MARFCANCGTEVDDTAVFCPTCGQPIDQDSETEMPAAPAWPESPSAREPAAEPEPAESSASKVDSDWSPPPTTADEPTRVEERPAPVAAVAPEGPPQRPPHRPPPGADAPRRGSAPMNLPIAMPVTLSAWLIGVGTVLAALGMLISLFDGALNPIELILLIVLLGVAATVFFAANLPAIPHLRLATLVVVLIAFGVALDRLGFGGAGVGVLLLFLGTAAAAIGAIILELGRDQPLGTPRG
ncbi:MAG: zinc ribbon domain-containing protein [Candidatus Limnocylindria bacterium]